MAIGTRVHVGVAHAQPSRLARVREWWEREAVFGYGLIIPALALITGLVAYPFAMAIYFSLSDYCLIIIFAPLLCKYIEI